MPPCVIINHVTIHKINFQWGGDHPCSILKFQIIELDVLELWGSLHPLGGCVISMLIFEGNMFLDTGISLVKR